MVLLTRDAAANCQNSSAGPSLSGSGSSRNRIERNAIANHQTDGITLTDGSYLFGNDLSGSPENGIDVLTSKWTYVQANTVHTLNAQINLEGALDVDVAYNHLAGDESGTLIGTNTGGVFIHEGGLSTRGSNAGSSSVKLYENTITDVNNRAVVNATTTSTYHVNMVEPVAGSVLAPGTVPWNQLVYPGIAGLHHWTADRNARDTLAGPRGWIEDQAEPAIWVPPLSTPWQWQLTGTIDESVDVQMYDIDLFDVSAVVVSRLQAKGRKVVCYMSAGTWENWRPDAAQFPASVRGKDNGWPGEKWLDIRRLDILGPILEQRMDLCKQKGFDALEPDNIDGYANNTGFPLTAEDQRQFNIWLAATAHARGLSIGLKNDLDQVNDLVSHFDWALNEQCFQYKECDLLTPFINAGKAVFVVEYSLATSQFCAQAVALKFNAMKKNLDLDAYRDPCPSPVIEASIYYLAEGATGPFFDLELALSNPNSADAPVTIQYLKEDGSTVNQSLTLGAQSRQTILVDGLAGLENTAVSTVVTSSSGLPLAVERTMTWDATGYGSHTEKATPGAAMTWYFAEGSEQGFFDTYLLLANPQASANRATVRFLVEGGTPVTKVYDLLPTSRTNVFAGDVEDPPGTKVLLNKAFGIVVTFDLPGVAERAMYFGTSPFWNGGHESAGVNAPSTSWFHAEGATGPFFDTFILLSNPNSTAATVTLTFLLDSGTTVTRTKTVGANARLTVGVEGEDALLADAAMATQVTSDVPVVSERAMYWAGYPNWYEAHNAFGVTATGVKWALGEGRVGGVSGYETYILLANPGTTAASVTVTYLREGGLAPLVQTYTVPATSRFNVYANAVPGLASGERFGALIDSTVPIAVERAMYSNAASQPGVVWAAGTNATAAPIP